MREACPGGPTTIADKRSSQDRCGSRELVRSSCYDGMPNSIWVGCVVKYDEDRLIVADNFFQKTRENIKDKSKGTLLWITEDNESYHVRGSIEYVTEGPMFDRMKKSFSEKLPRVAAAVIQVEEVYSGAEKLA